MSVEYSEEYIVIIIIIIPLARISLRQHRHMTSNFSLRTDRQFSCLSQLTSTFGKRAMDLDSTSSLWAPSLLTYTTSICQTDLVSNESGYDRRYFLSWGWKKMIAMAMGHTMEPGSKCGLFHNTGAQIQD